MIFGAGVDAAARTRIMAAFFARGRADLATLVFGHMRAEDLGSPLRPRAETYAACFAGLAACAERARLHLSVPLDGDPEATSEAEADTDIDVEPSLRMVHNMLKMDMSVRLGPRVLDALLAAYVAVGEAGAAMDVFDAVLASEAGPSRASLRAFFRACETHPLGRARARALLARLDELGVPVDRALYAG
ncbi:hypothetical protein KEM52_004923, partial [Ascosphaera acerosa]